MLIIIVVVVVLVVLVVSTITIAVTIIIIITITVTITITIATTTNELTEPKSPVSMRTVSTPTIPDGQHTGRPTNANAIFKKLEGGGDSGTRIGAILEAAKFVLPFADHEN